MQTESGMHGMIIIEDDKGSPLNDIEEFIMVASIFQYPGFTEMQKNIHDYEGFR